MAIDSFILDPQTYKRSFQLVYKGILKCYDIDIPPICQRQNTSETRNVKSDSLVKDIFKCASHAMGLVQPRSLVRPTSDF